LRQIFGETWKLAGYPSYNCHSPCDNSTDGVPPMKKNEYRRYPPAKLALDVLVLAGACFVVWWTLFFNGLP